MLDFDQKNNELLYLHQVLNEYFHNVCELDLVFNFYKVPTKMQQIISSWSIDARQVYSIVDEMFLAGELRETSQTKVTHQIFTHGNNKYSG